MFGPIDVQHFPGTNLRRFGINPLGVAIYRCVWSDSRLHCVGGKWPDGAVEYRWIPRYPHSSWVLEKWLSAFDFGGSRLMYEVSMRDDESGLLTIPYPVNGDYEHCYSFPPEAGASSVERICELIEAGRKFTPAELAAAHLKVHAMTQMAWASRVEGIIGESQQAFGNRASNVNPSKLTEDKMRVASNAPLDVIGDGKPFTRS